MITFDNISKALAPLAASAALLAGAGTEAVAATEFHAAPEAYVAKQNAAGKKSPKVVRLTSIQREYWSLAVIAVLGLLLWIAVFIVQPAM